LIVVVRILAIAVAIALGTTLLAWLLTGDRRWLRIAWTVFRYAAFGLLAILLLFAGESLLHS
jgi:cell division protein FtsW (lipid II flippase)